jgi:hypothetical protein
MQKRKVSSHHGQLAAAVAATAAAAVTAAAYVFNACAVNPAQLLLPLFLCPQLDRDISKTLHTGTAVSTGCWQQQRMTCSSQQQGSLCLFVLMTAA